MFSTIRGTNGLLLMHNLYYTNGRKEKQCYCKLQHEEINDRTIPLPISNTFPTGSAFVLFYIIVGKLNFKWEHEGREG